MCCQRNDPDTRESFKGSGIPEAIGSDGVVEAGGMMGFLIPASTTAGRITRGPDQVELHKEFLIPQANGRTYSDVLAGVRRAMAEVIARNGGRIVLGAGSNTKASFELRYTAWENHGKIGVVTFKEGDGVRIRLWCGEKKEDFGH